MEGRISQERLRRAYNFKKTVRARGAPTRTQAPKSFAFRRELESRNRRSGDGNVKEELGGNGEDEGRTTTTTRKKKKKKKKRELRAGKWEDDDFFRNRGVEEEKEKERDKERGEACGYGGLEASCAGFPENPSCVAMAMAMAMAISKLRNRFSEKP
jgi:hypothetical protein